MARSGRAMLAGLWLSAGLSALACGKTVDHQLGEASTSGAGGGFSTGGSGVSGGDLVGVSGESDIGGSGGSSPVGGGDSGQVAEGGKGGQLNAPGCVDGALCQCGNDVGTLHCEGPTRRCSCPAAEVCEKTLVTCFQPCGGDPYGSWVLEQTCLAGSSTSQSCAGGFLRGGSKVNDLRLQILENEPISAMGDEGLKLEARVPLSCLGIESVNRCSDAVFYAAPLLYAPSASFGCEATECGDCKCTGSVSAFAGLGFPGQGDAFQPGSMLLSFDSVKVPYCVNEDTLWVGGRLLDGTPKVSYKFRRSSCEGTPVPCEQRVAPECGTDGSCNPGHCVATGNKECDGLGYDACFATTGCAWGDEDKCFGSTAERCEFRNCDATPGCSWGAPRARCGGEPKRCFTYEPEACPAALGCKLSNCIWGDGPDEPVNCYAIMSSSECAKAVGCTWSGNTCSGFTRCWDQTDVQACSGLGCSAVGSPQCDGSVNVQCSALSVDACSSVPGCRLEW